MALSPEQHKLIAIIEAYHFRNRQPPPWDYLESHPDIPGNLLPGLRDPAAPVSIALINRGVYRILDPEGLLISDSEPSFGDFLDPERMAVAQIVSNLFDKRSIKKRLEDLNISEDKYRGWLQDEHFRNYLRGRAENLLEEEIPSLHQTVLKLAEGGDHKAIKLAYELEGRLAPANRGGAVAVNIMGDQAILAKLVEAIQRHVTDQSVLSAIAAEFAQIVSPQVASQPPVSTRLPMEITRGNLHF